MNRAVRPGPFALLVVSWIICGAATARAAVYQTSLDTLVPGGASQGGIVIGSYRFSDFSFRNTGPFAVTPADVTVRLSNENPGQMIAQLGFGTDAAAGQSGSVSIHYRVDHAYGMPMNRTGVRFSGPVPSQGPGPGSVAVDQTISTLDGSDVSPLPPVAGSEALTIFNDGPGRLEDSNSAFLRLNPTLALRLSSETVLTGYQAGRLEVSLSNNFFTIPEPSDGFMPVASGIALLARRRGMKFGR